jgi:hypothetical protein
MQTRRKFITEGATTAATVAAAGSVTSLLVGCAYPASIPAVLPASFHDVAGSRSLRDSCAPPRPRLWLRGHHS